MERSAGDLAQSQPPGLTGVHRRRDGPAHRRKRQDVAQQIHARNGTGAVSPAAD